MFNIPENKPLRFTPPYFIIFLTALFIFVKYGSYSFFETFYISKNLNILHTLAGTHVSMDFTTMWGYIHERFVGPLEQMLSGIVLALILLKYFKQSSLGKFWLIVFIFLLITKWEILFWPTYGEANAGHFIEAMWLLDHQFDYKQLVAQKHFAQGGPKSYLISIFPTYLALLMKFIPNTTAFLFFAHTVVFAMSAGIITIFRNILLNIVSPKAAILSSIILLMLPLYQCQTELINMEVPAVLFAVATAFFLLDKRFIVAGICAVMASLYKGTGGMACAGYLAFVGCLFLFDEKYRFKPQYLIGGLLVFLIGFSKKYLRYYLYPQEPTNSTVEFLIGWQPLTGCKYLILSLFILCAGFFIIYVKEKIQRQQPFIKRHTSAAIMFIYALIWYALYVNVSVMGPRYKLLVTPFLVASLIFVAQYFLRSKKILNVVLWITLIATSIGSYGLYFPDKYENAPYNYNNLERSLEYRNDQLMVMALGKKLESEHIDKTIVAPFPLAQMLAFPRLGFVGSKLDIVSYEMNTYYGGLRNFEGIFKLDLNNTIFVGTKNSMNIPIPYPIDPNDQVFDEVRIGNKKATLFTGGIAIEKVYRALIGTPAN